MLSKLKHKLLAEKVDNEGFGYYMLHYGPDITLLENLGFNKQDIEKAIELFLAIEEKIYKGFDYE